MNFKCKLKLILTEKEIKYGEFAAQVKVSLATMSGLMNNRTLPSFAVAYRISEVLEMDIKEIWIKIEEEEN
ncbi:helix-turn-helix domain-containing protein [Peribacillus frigoritolerans]|uniref:helix-turn-helix domain-containing protein n=1 Tax=Peribacillus frigoritolerans TaxID=450367 RepID=UPI003CFBDCE2